MNITFHPKTESEVKADRNDIRNAVKQVIRLHKDNQIDENAFKFLIQLAMAYEISESLEDKFKAKDKKLFKGK
ncbi:MAG: hypothetical protein ACOYYU_16925 [Chloroflexota bacterium]